MESLGEVSENKLTWIARILIIIYALITVISLSIVVLCSAVLMEPHVQYLECDCPLNGTDAIFNLPILYSAITLGGAETIFALLSIYYTACRPTKCAGGILTVSVWLLLGFLTLAVMATLHGMLTDVLMVVTFILLWTLVPFQIIGLITRCTMVYAKPGNACCCDVTNLAQLCSLVQALEKGDPNDNSIAYCLDDMGHEINNIDKSHKYHHHQTSEEFRVMSEKINFVGNPQPRRKFPYRSRRSPPAKRFKTNRGSGRAIVFSNFRSSFMKSSFRFFKSFRVGASDEATKQTPLSTPTTRVALHENVNKGDVSDGIDAVDNSPSDTVFEKVTPLSDYNLDSHIIHSADAIQLSENTTPDNHDNPSTSLLSGNSRSCPNLWCSPRGVESAFSDSTYVEIPSAISMDETWKAVVAKSVKQFTTPESSSDTYAHTETAGPSPLNQAAYGSLLFDSPFNVGQPPQRLDTPYGRKRLDTPYGRNRLSASPLDAERTSPNPGLATAPFDRHQTSRRPIPHTTPPACAVTAISSPLVTSLADSNIEHFRNDTLQGDALDNLTFENIIPVSPIIIPTSPIDPNSTYQDQNTMDLIPTRDDQDSVDRNPIDIQTVEDPDSVNLNIFIVSPDLNPDIPPFDYDSSYEQCMYHLRAINNRKRKYGEETVAKYGGEIVMNVDGSEYSVPSTTTDRILDVSHFSGDSMII